jgi:hypothetical protein
MRVVLLIVIMAVLSVLVLGGAAVLVYFLGRWSQSGHARTTLLSVLFVVAVMLTGFAVGYASIFYVKPPLAIAGVVLGGALVIGLFVLIGRDVKWKPVAVACLIGLLVLGNVMFGLIATGASSPGGSVLQPLYRTRANQIAEKAGFVALFPAQLSMITDSLPVDALPRGEKGVYMAYDGLEIQERPASGRGTIEDLRRVVASGSTTQWLGLAAIPPQAQLTSMTHRGPAARRRLGLHDAVARARRDPAAGSAHVDDGRRKPGGGRHVRGGTRRPVARVRRAKAHDGRVPRLPEGRCRGSAVVRQLRARDERHVGHLPRAPGRRARQDRRDDAAGAVGLAGSSARLVAGAQGSGDAAPSRSSAAARRRACP